MLSRFLSLSFSVCVVTHSLTHSHLRLGGEVLIPGTHEAGVQIYAATVCYQDDDHDCRGEKKAYHQRDSFNAV